MVELKRIKLLIQMKGIPLENTNKISQDDIDKIVEDEVTRTNNGFSPEEMLVYKRILRETKYQIGVNIIKEEEGRLKTQFDPENTIKKT